MAAYSRWAGLLGIAAGNVLPLVLVWEGHLEVGDLVLVYLLELAIGYALVIHAGVPRGSVADRLKHWTALIAGGLLVGGFLTYHALRHVSWDATTLWMVALTLVSSLVGLAVSIRARGAGWRRGLGGAFAWRFVLMVVALMAASAGTAYERLLPTGWEPHRFGNGWALPAGELLTRLALLLDLAPVVVAAGILCTYRLVSELLYEVFDILRDQASGARAE